MTVEYSDAITNTMLSAPRQAVLLAGSAAFRSTDGMATRTLADIPSAHRSLYDLCACGGPKRTKAVRCLGCTTAASPEDRFWSKVEKAPGCWQWTGNVSTQGYGRFRMGGRAHQAHRVSFEMVRGAIPDGMELDHLCRVRACVRPDHLEPVTTRENLLRGYGPPALNARRTTCRFGHPLDGVRKSGACQATRFCTTCKAAQQADWRARRGAEANRRKRERRALAAALTDQERGS